MSDKTPITVVPTEWLDRIQEEITHAIMGAGTGRLHDISTHTLVRELRTREGVETLLHTSDHDCKTVLAAGPCLVLRVFD